MKFILHIDMNAFFASVEELQNPKYKDKPIAVSGKTKRSVVCSANYLARKKGVRAAMPIYQATNICKDLIIVIPHFDLYQKYSQKFHEIIEEEFTNKIESFSIDECFVDISTLANNEQESKTIAKKIQLAILNKTGLSCSIGVSYNKFLSKMASDFKKPMGISTLFHDEIKSKLWPLDIGEMLWIGKSTADVLRSHGITTIGDMANKNNLQIIQKLLDKNWYSHIQHANGIGDDKLNLSQDEPKSISVSETFLNDTNDYDEITKCLRTLTIEAVERLNKHRLFTKTITVYVKYPNFIQQNKSIPLNKITNDFENIWLKVIRCYQKYFNEKDIRLIGVKLDNLSKWEVNLFNMDSWYEYL